MSAHAEAAAEAVIIEVGMNEFTTRKENPHVPFTPEEVAEDARACYGAGATIVHFHARDASGAQLWGDADFYRKTMEMVAHDVDAPLWYTTYLGHHAHDWELAERPPTGAPLRISSFDVPQEIRANVLWDPAARCFEVAAGMQVEEFDDDAAAALNNEQLLVEIADRGLSPSVAAFDVGEARWAVLALRAGLVSSPLDLKVFLSDRLVKGPSATPAGVDAYLSEIPDDLDVQVVVVPFAMRDGRACQAVLERALERGAHVRVGIGDNPVASPEATNAELVARVADLARAAGRVPASFEQARRLLGIDPPAG
jgi:3-keto-5-aminohexanoate cleavage enzyme